MYFPLSVALEKKEKKLNGNERACVKLTTFSMTTDLQFSVHLFSGWLSQNSDENPRMRMIPHPNSHKNVRMRGFSSLFCDNQPENRCKFAPWKCAEPW